MVKESVKKLHIAIIGRRQVGKSLLIEQLIIREITTNKKSENSMEEPISKLVELNPFLPSVVISIASIEQHDGFWENSKNKCLKAISNANIVLIVLDARNELDKNESIIITHLQKKKIPFLIAVNKIEYGTNSQLLTELEALDIVYFEVSCKENAGIESLKKKLVHLLPD